MRMTTRTWTGLWLGMMILQMALATGNPQSAPAKPDEKSLAIEPDMVLEIYVWREPDLTRTVTVRPDGNISLPLIQDLHAAGLTASQLRQEIESRLKLYLSAPVATVIIQPSDSFSVYVLGNVATPGVFRSRQALTVLQALALGGRFGDFANIEDILVVRGTGAGAQLFRFNYKEILKGRGLDQNILLQNNDVVLIP